MARKHTGATAYPTTTLPDGTKRVRFHRLTGLRLPMHLATALDLWVAALRLQEQTRKKKGLTCWGRRPSRTSVVTQILNLVLSQPINPRKGAMQVEFSARLLAALPYPLNYDKKRFKTLLASPELLPPTSEYRPKNNVQPNL